MVFQEWKPIEKLVQSKLTRVWHLVRIKLTQIKMVYLGYYNFSITKSKFSGCLIFLAWCQTMISLIKVNLASMFAYLSLKENTLISKRTEREYLNVLKLLSIKKKTHKYLAVNKNLERYMKWKFGISKRQWWNS